jgi:hypothetical protein
MRIRESEDFFGHHSMALRRSVWVVRGEVGHSESYDALGLDCEGARLDPITQIMFHHAHSSGLNKKSSSHKK